MKAFPWRNIVLFLSLALNLFLAAVIGAHMLRAQMLRHDLARQTPLQRALLQAEAALSPRDRAIFDKTLLAGEPGFTRAADQLALARHKLAAELLAQPYDPTATAAAMDAWQQGWLQFQSAFRGPLLSALGAISPQGRRALVEARRQHDIPEGH